MRTLSACSTAQRNVVSPPLSMASGEAANSEITGFGGVLAWACCTVGVGAGFTATFFEQPAAIKQAAPIVAQSNLFTESFLQEKFPKYTLKQKRGLGASRRSGISWRGQPEGAVMLAA